MSRVPDGFAEFVSVRSSALLRVAWLLTGDSATAEDLLQTALAEVWPKWSRIGEGQNPEAYVRRVLISVFLSSRRRRWRGEVPSDEFPDPIDGTDIAGQSATRDAVRRALAGLSPQQRSVVVLRYVEDLSIEETASVLACSTGTVKVQAGRALERLRADPHLRLSPIAGWEA